MTDIPPKEIAARFARSLAPICPMPASASAGRSPPSAALTIASAATLVMPLAVRGMIDKGFAVDHAATINFYFLALIAVVVRARDRLGHPLFPGDHLRRAHRRRPARRCLRPSHPARPGLLRHSPDRRTRLAAVRRHHPDQVHLRRDRLHRAAQHRHVRRRDRADGLYQPQTVDARPGRHSRDLCRCSPRAARCARGRGPRRTRSPKPTPSPPKISRPSASCRRSARKRRRRRVSPPPPRAPTGPRATRPAPAPCSRASPFSGHRQRGRRALARRP